MIDKKVLDIYRFMNALAIVGCRVVHVILAPDLFTRIENVLDQADGSYFLFGASVEAADFMPEDAWAVRVEVKE